MGGDPPPPMPPVDHESDCHATSVPSFFAAHLILAKAEGRLPAIMSSMLRSRNHFTGLPVEACESFAFSAPPRSGAHLRPKPQYTLSICTGILSAANLSVLPISAA